jgi:hypothetical protein
MLISTDWGGEGDEVRRRVSIVTLDTHIKFHEDWYRRSRFRHSNLRDHNVGVNGGRDL